jgi:hypothetical protein
MRAAAYLAGATAILAALAVRSAHAEDLPTTPAGFDHLLHARNVDVSGAAPIPCARCHVDAKGRLTGTIGHAACFATCHGPAPSRPRRGARVVIEPERKKLCTNCHAEAVLAQPFGGKLVAVAPPYQLDPDFNIAIGHKQHAQVACTQCHDLRPARKRRVPHQRCAGCHDGSGLAGRGPTMTSCEGCHPRSVGKPQPPALAVVHDSVTSTFSHPSHAARGNKGRDCVTCHAGVRDTDDTQLPRPIASDCASAGCHDAVGAFGVTAACSRCHTQVPEVFRVARPTTRFLHTGVHADVISQRPCIACHALSGRGEPLVANHDACVACHAADFGDRQPRTCGACHNATEPWRRLVPDRAPPARTEFGATLSHATHIAPCEGCHVLRTPSAQLRPPRGHGACTGAGCHATSTGPAPRLARVTAPWSVRRAFDHALHRTAPDGSTVACQTCHTDLTGTTIGELPTPAKATCAPCHDATKPAFKLTGTTCTRCHGGDAR